MKKSQKITKHHRKPRCLNGADGDNISLVPENKHKAYHLLFKEGEPEYIAMVLNRTWVDKDWVIVAMRREGR